MGLLFGSKRDRARDETLRQQATAADPTASAWVSANAGTGKTHVLVMRLLRLLLAGTPPERILALTYTKAAAAEMAKRVFDRLGKWVIATERDLADELRKLTGRAPSAAEMQRARQLFAVAIETPGGLKVQTIHAFCERLLQRFPMEVGVPPGFSILEQEEQTKLLREAADEVLAAAMSDESSALARSLKCIIAFAAEGDFDAVLAEAMRHEWFAATAWIDRESNEELEQTERIYRRALDLPADARLADVEEKLATVLTEAELRELQGILSTGSAGDDAKAAQRIAAALRAGQGLGRIDALCQVFLATTGEARKTLFTKALIARHPGAHDRMTRAQGTFVALLDVRRRLQLLDVTMALLRLGHAVMQRYAEAKARRAALDFDDLVAKAANLLGSSRFAGSPAAVEWVLYKLDGGLDHILIDEAQDTSPLQWQVIGALADEFFAGHGAHETTRTLFAVGDEKQSIYSFQGAAPAMFAKIGKAFKERAEQARMVLRPIPLTLSFRSVEPLLEAVDRIFSDPARTPGLTASQAAPKHSADRVGQAGLVEIWPTEKKETAPASEPWAPLAEGTVTEPVVRLAARIADTIKGWLQHGEKLRAEDRPIRAGDILILVRKRMPFAPVMVSALKARGIPVAGADRLVLTEQIAVQDLMALGDFLMLPEDDLALAAVLKSPLFGLDDDALLSFAPERKDSLWAEMKARADQDARLSEAAKRLECWLAEARTQPPFEFYANVLDRDGMRARMLARLGAEAADALDEFLNLALGYDARETPSLLGFLSWLREGRREIKRDMEQGRDEVRVMTVHGAKGLEAPIVFLPDTCSTESGRRPTGLLTLADADRPVNVPPPILWPVKGTSKVAAVQTAKAAVKTAETEERNRLLYVALTRARDRLYVAGFEGSRAPPPDCWYNLIYEALQGQLKELSTPYGPVWRLESAQTAPCERAKVGGTAAPASMPLPDWAWRRAPQEPRLAVPLAPSRLAPLESGDGAAGRRRRVEEPPVLSPMALAENDRFLRGTLTHGLLEHLPALPPQQWASAAMTFLESRARQLTEAARAQIRDETLRILQDPKFAALFGPDSRAEVPIVAEIPRPDGDGPPLRVAGKIDRLVRAGEELRIVDYKTNRPPPRKAEDIAEAYLLQLAAYRLAIARIFPGTHVRAAILWTDGPRIMEIAESLLEVGEQRLWSVAPSNLDA